MRQDQHLLVDRSNGGTPMAKGQEKPQKSNKPKLSIKEKKAKKKAKSDAK